jgi:hypothetical protein
MRRRRTTVLQRRRPDSGAIQDIVRFVLLDDHVAIVPLAANAQRAIEPELTNGIPAPDGTRVWPRDGEAFLNGLLQWFTGSRWWVTDIVEMEEDEALRGIDHDT